MPITRAEEIKRKFDDFHAGNPEIYDLFCAFTKELIDLGFASHSADSVIHRVRWESAIKTKGKGFKINNNFVAHYARKWMDEHPKYPDFFSTRELISEGKLAA